MIPNFDLKDLLLTPGTLGVSFEFDTDDLRGWDVRWSWEGPFGFFSQRGTLFDAEATGPSGESLFVAQVHTFFQGKIASTVYYDLARAEDGSFSNDSGLHGWRSKIITYGPGREVLTQTIHFDNDSVRQVTRNEDGSRVALHLDGEAFGGADNFEWISKTDIFGTDGQITDKQVIEDDGDKRSYTYLDGRVDMRLIEDISDSEDWYAHLRQRDPDGSGWDNIYFDSAAELIDYFRLSDLDLNFV